MTVVNVSKCLQSLMIEIQNLTSKIDELSTEVQRLHHRFDKVEAEIHKDAVSPVWEDLDDVSLHRPSDNVKEDIEEDAASNAWQAVPTASAVAASNDGERNSSTSSSSAAAPPQNAVPASNAWQAVPTASAVAASNGGERNSSTSSWSAAAPPQNSVPDAPQDTPVPAPVPEPRCQIPPNQYRDLGDWCNDCQFNRQWTLPLDAASYATLMKKVFSDFQGAGIHADGTVNITWPSQPWSVAQSLLSNDFISAAEYDVLAKQIAQVQWTPAAPDSRQKKFCLHGGKKVTNGSWWAA